MRACEHCAICGLHNAYFAATTQVFIRRSCPLCGKQIIMAHLRKLRYKTECVKSISSSLIVSPSLQRGGTTRYTHNILLSVNKELSHSFSSFNSTCPPLIPLTTRCARWRPNKLKMSA